MAGFDNNVVYANNVDFSGSTSPSAQITTNGQLLIGSTTSPNIRVANLTSSDSSVTITNGPGTINLQAKSFATPVSIANGGTNATSFTASNGIVTYNGTQLVNYTGPQINSSGYYTNTTQPSCSVKLSTASSVTGDGTAYTIVYDVVQFDNDSNYNNSTGVFTAPVSGIYFCTVGLTLHGLSSSHNLASFEWNTPAVQYTQQWNPFGITDPNGDAFFSSTMTFNLTASQTLSTNITVLNGSKSVGFKTAGGTQVYTWMSIALLS